MAGFESMVEMRDGRWQAKQQRSTSVEIVERRDPTAATAPLAYQTVGHPMVPEWDAEQAIRWAYLANVFVYACARAIAQDLSALPFRAGEDPDKPNDWNPKARLAQLLGPTPGGPAPKLSARRLFAWSIVQRQITGRMAWELELDRRDQIAAMWPLVAPKLKAVPTQSGAEWFAGFRYGKPGDERTLRPEQVFYSWVPSQTDFRQPESPLQAARLDVSVAVMQDRYDYAFLRNDARPAAVVVTEAFAKQEDFEAFKGSWRGEYGGPENAGKTAFLESEGGPDGVKNAILVQTLGLSQKDAEFIQRYESKVRSICIAMGVPMSRLMDASKRTFNNAGQETTNYWVNTLLPLAMDLQDDINMSLAPRLGGEVGWFDVSRVEALRPKPRITAQEAVALVSGGVASADEMRPEFGLLPLGDNALLVASDPAPADGAADPAANMPPLAVAASAPEGEQRHPEPPVSPQEQAAITEARRARIWRSADAQVRILEGQWERRWRSEFIRQERAVMDRLHGRRGRQMFRTTTDGEVRETPDPAALFDPAFWTSEAVDLSTGLYEAVFAVGGARVSDLFGVAFDLESISARTFVQARANQLAGQVTDTTYQAIKDQMVEGVAEGEGIDQIAARIREVFDRATSWRAEMIARTEVVSAFNGSAFTVAAQLPADVVAGHEWIATRDARTRDAHAGADGQAVRTGAPFQVGGEHLAYPGDPNGSASNVINCRCTIAFLTPDEMDDRARSKPATVVELDVFTRAAARVATGARTAAQALLEVAS